jgi:dienelactone hydrolase
MLLHLDKVTLMRLSKRYRHHTVHRLVCVASVVSVALAVLGACSTDQPSGPTDADFQAFAARGYGLAEHGVASTSTYAWSVSGQAVSVVVSRPEGTNAAPVVIYLPGLGEPSEAGELWRTAWSSAGYAVLSVQLLAADGLAWSSDFARKGEFRKLGLDRFGGPTMHRRLQLLADVVAEAQHRSAYGEAAWTRMDWSRVAIAGYDVGAYAAMVAAGEHLDGAEDSAGRLKIRAVIALSPFANPAAGSIDSRYRDIRLPVLSVTSNADGDPLGLMDGAALRSVPFDHMRGPDKYLLTLQDVSHARLGGNAGATVPEPQPAKRASAASLGDDAGQRRGSGQRRSREESDEPTVDRVRAVDRAVVPGLSASALRMRVLAAQSISTAFLDATLKDDSRARVWLANDAPRWVVGLGTMAWK